jgi:hypothetical protein
MDVEPHLLLEPDRRSRAEVAPLVSAFLLPLTTMRSPALTGSKSTAPPPAYATAAVIACPGRARGSSRVPVSGEETAHRMMARYRRFVYPGLDDRGRWSVSDGLHRRSRRAHSPSWTTLSPPSRSTDSCPDRRPPWEQVIGYGGEGWSQASHLSDYRETRRCNAHPRSVRAYRPCPACSIGSSSPSRTISLRSNEVRFSQLASKGRLGGDRQSSSVNCSSNALAIARKADRRTADPPISPRIWMSQRRSCDCGVSAIRSSVSRGCTGYRRHAVDASGSQLMGSLDHLITTCSGGHGVDRIGHHPTRSTAFSTTPRDRYA